MTAEKILTVTLRFRPDGTAVIEGAGLRVERFGNATAGAERRVRDFNLTAVRQSQVVEAVTSRLKSMLLSVTALAGAGGLALLAKRGYDYQQSLEAQRNTLAGILAMNRGYVDSAGRMLDANAAFQAGLSEADGLLATIQQRAVETAATVPQIGDAFATALSAAKASGLRQDLGAILDTTIRIVQAAGAFSVPMEQLRQEVNSLFSGQITEDSVIARKLGFDGESVRKAIAAGSLYEEIISRTEALSVAAQAQANTLSGVVVNVAEIIDSVVAKGLSRSIGGIRDFVAGIGATILRHSTTISFAITAATDAIADLTTRMTQWVREHSDLVKEIAAIGAVVLAAIAAYALLGLAIAAVTSPITLTIAGIVALALAWEKAREFGHIEVDGRPISAYVRTSWAVIAGVTTHGVNTLLTAYRVLWHGAKAIFGSLVEIVIAPMRAVTSLLARIPDGVAAMVPEARLVKSAAIEIKALLDTTSAAMNPLENFAAVGRDIAEGWSVGGEIVEDTLTKAEAALTSKEALPSIADAIFGGVADAFSARIEQMKSTAENAVTGSPAARATSDTSSSARRSIKPEIADAFAEYEALVDNIRTKGDPVSEALASIASQRRAALKEIREASTNADFAGIAHDYEKDAADVNASFARQAVEAVSETIAHVNEKTLAGMRAVKSLAHTIAAQIEDDRIASIKDGTEREFAERIRANEQWFESERERIDEELTIEAQKNEALAKLAIEKGRRDARDSAEAAQRREAERVGFAAWTAKIREDLLQRLGTIPQQITEATTASLDAVRSGFDQLFEGFTRGEIDFGGLFDSVTKQIGASWSKLLSNMLTRTVTTGESIVTQFRALSQQINNMEGLDAIFAGAGIGSTVGGIGQALAPETYAGVGGTIGGALGAVIGSFFGATSVGAWIGSAIGTAIGSAIQKGQDEIKVHITTALDGTAAVDVIEKGISAAARTRVIRDIRRQVDDAVKGYQSIIDLFPEELRQQIRAQIKPLDIRGGTESAEIADENALSALSSFLSEGMLQGVFDSYVYALRKGLALVGVADERVHQEMQRLAQLQGSELQESVRTYIATLLETIELRDVFAAPFEEMEQAAREAAGQTQLQRISAINGQLEEVVSTVAQLDVSDQLTAAKEVNRLTRQKYDMEIAYLQKLDAIQQRIAQSSQQLRDQVKLAGLGDQGKLDFFFERMRGLRTQLQTATNEDEIERITQQIHGYISQALSLAPGDAQLRAQLLQIIDDVEAVSGGQLSAARAAVEEQHRKTAELLASAADALMSASTALRDVVGGGDQEQPDPSDPDPVDPGPDVPGLDTIPMTTAVNGVVREIERLSSSLAQFVIPDALATRWTDFEDGVALALANVSALNERASGERAGDTRPSDMTAVVALLQRIADRDEREIHISGDGRAALEAWGFRIEERIVRRLRSDRDLSQRFADY